MNPFNFNLPIVVIFVLIGLGVGLSLKFLGKMAKIGSVETPQPQRPKEIDSEEEDEIVPEPTISKDSKNTKNITDESEDSIDSIDSITTLKPTEEINENAIQLVQTILLNSSDVDVPLTCAMSTDGTRMAVGGILQNSVYIYDSQEHTFTIPSASTHEEITYGSVVSLSGDGNTLAIGSTFSNASSLVEIYSYREEWIRSGTISSIPILLFDATHISLSLSYTGKYLVIGNSNSSASGPDTGQVQFFKYSTEWIVDDTPPISGDDIYGTGLSVFLYTYNGTLVLAVSSPFSGMNYTGSVSVFEYNELYSTWRILGDSIVGIQTDSNLGISLSLTTNPFTTSLMLAIGSKYHEYDDSKHIIQDKFTIYEYSKMGEESRFRGISSKWMLQNTIHNGINGIPNQQNALSLNGNNCIVLSSPFTFNGYVTIHCYEEEWKKLGQILRGGDFFGYCVALSDVVDGRSILMVSNKVDRVFVYRVNYDYDLNVIT